MHGSDPLLPNSPCDLVLQDLQRSVIVCGGVGSGKSTALDAMQHALAADALFVPWDPAHVGACPQERLDAALYAGLCSAVGNRVAELVRDAPARFAALSRTSREFVRWLLERSLPVRRRTVLGELVPDLGAILADTTYRNPYPDHDAESIRGALDEMVLVARVYGQQKIVLLYDAPDSLAPQEMAVLTHLVGWRDLWQQRDILLRAALTISHPAERELADHARGRITFCRLRWEPEQCVRLVRLDEFAAPDLCLSLRAMLYDIYDEHTPGKWLWLGAIVRDYHAWRGRTLTQAEDLDDLRRRVYHKLAPLRIDSDRGVVWRGERPLPVRPLPLSVLVKLAGLPSGQTHDALLNITGSEANLHKQVSELRKAIEPLPPGSRAWVYVCSGGQGNYFLDANAQVVR